MAAALAFFAAGLFHGAADESDGEIRRYTALRGFAYVVVAAGVSALYLAAPLAGLTTFLLLSAWHFATSACSFDRFARYGIAGLVVGGSALFRPIETGDIFAAITAGEFPPVLLTAFAALGVGGALCAVIAAVQGRRGAAHALGALMATAVLAPPLAVGLVFFAAHAVPVQQRQVASHGQVAVLRAVAPAGMIALGGAAFLALGITVNLVPLTLAVALAFGLATPHMLSDRLEPVP